MLPRANLAADAAARLEQSIRDGALQPGDRLPSEAQIGKQLGVSRTVVREAIAYMKGDGIVESRRGLGLFVNTPDASRLNARDIDASATHILEFLEFRAGLEADAAALAATRRTPDDMAKIDAALAHLTAAEREGRDGADEDLAFHLAIAEAAHSYLFPKVLGFLSAALRQTMVYMRRQDEISGDYIKTRRDFHVQIRDLVHAQDAEGARAAMRAHMNSTYARYAPQQAAPPTQEPRRKRRPNNA